MTDVRVYNRHFSPTILEKISFLNPPKTEDLGFIKSESMHTHENLSTDMLFFLSCF